jgi:hypothetical protein
MNVEDLTVDPANGGVRIGVELSGVEVASRTVDPVDAKLLAHELLQAAEHAEDTNAD